MKFWDGLISLSVGDFMLLRVVNKPGEWKEGRFSLAQYEDAKSSLWKQTCRHPKGRT